MTNASFCHSNLNLASFNRANLENTDFSHANLHEATFANTFITDEQLKSALSIHDTLLSNGTRTYGKNLINDGKTSCNIYGGSGWILRNGNVTIVKPSHSSSYCEFSLQSVSTGATIYQRFDIAKYWNPILWPYAQAVLSANVSFGVSIELSGIKSNDQILKRRTLSKFCCTSFST